MGFVCRCCCSEPHGHPGNVNGGEAAVVLLSNELSRSVP